jgi:hypothetical protein
VRVSVGRMTQSEPLSKRAKASETRTLSHTKPLAPLFRLT